VGQGLLAKRPVRELTDTWSQAYEAWRPRELRQEPGAYLFIETVDAPLRRWGQKTGVVCGGASCEEGRNVLLSLSPTKRER
jgi:hypothetical protein